MKTQLAIFLAIMCATPFTSAERLIPFDEFYISVDTNESMDRGENEASVDVSVRMARGPEESNGSSASIEVVCRKFDYRQQMLPETDLEAFFEAGKAATKGGNFRREVMTETFSGKRKTVYEVVLGNGKSKILMSRGEEVAAFTPGEVNRVRHALEQARAGEAWYRKLLTAETPPEPNNQAEPPKSSGYYMNSTVGIVSGKGIGYAVSVGSYAPSSTEYVINHELFLCGADGQMNRTLGAGDLLAKIAAALEAIKEGTPYSFTSEEGADGGRFTVTANLTTKEADVELDPGNFFKDRGPEKGHFGQVQLDEIRKLITDCGRRIKWFQAHESLFFARSPKKEVQSVPSDAGKPSK